jgi:hypothetical protein
MYAAGRTVPLALITLAAIYKRSTSALLISVTLAGVTILVVVEDRFGHFSIVRIGESNTF